MLPSVVEHLIEYFPEESGNILWPILQNEAARKSLENKAFSVSILSGGLNAENWRLGSLARICLIKQEEALPDLRSDARSYLLAQLSRAPLEGYKLNRRQPDEVRFAIAGAWAGELLKLVNDTGWDEFKHLLGIGTDTFPNQTLPVLSTALICMADLLNDPSELIENFREHFSDKEVVQFCTFIFCSYYFDNDILVKQLMNFLRKISLSARVDGLRYLYQHDKRELAAILAGQLLESGGDFQPSQTGTTSLLDDVYAMANRYYRLTLLEFSGDQQEGERAWKELENAGSAWKAGLFLQKAQILKSWKGLIDFQDNLENLRKNDFDTQPLLDEAWSLSNQHEFPVTIQNANQSPFTLIRQYGEASIHNQLAEADALAEQIISDLKTCISVKNNFQDSKYLFKMNYNSIVEKFLQENDLEHAELAADILLAESPSDVELLNYSAEIKEKQGNIQEALDLKILESAFVPQDPALIKQLSEFYYKSGESGKAYRQLKKLLEMDGALNEADHLKLAQMAYESNDFAYVDQAVAPLLDAAEVKGTALVILGKTRMAQGYFDEAVSFFRQSIEENPYIPERWVYLCEACRKDTEERDILGILNEGLGYLSDSATIHTEIAQEYYLKNRVSDALSYLEKAVSFPPDSKEGVITAGTLIVRMGDVQKAFEYYMNVLNRFEFDKDIARQAAMSALDNEEYEAAESILTSLFGQIKPTADDIASFILARLKGKSPIFSDDLDISAEELTRLNEKMDEGLKLDPEHLGINLLRAEMKAYLGDYEDAREIFRMLIEHDNTSHWKTLGGYGYASMKMGDIHTAIAALQESYSINPEQTKLEQYLAEAYLEAGLLVDARLYADKVFESKSNDPATLIWYADLNGKMGEWEKVVTALKNAYHLNPGDPDIIMRLAEGFVKTGRKEDANHLARLLLGLPDLNTDILMGLANLMTQMGEWARVCDLLEKCLDAGYPEPSQIHFAMSLMHQKMGDYEQALSFSQKTIASIPDNYYLYIHQADLLYLLDKTQAALSCLDYADQIQSAADMSIFQTAFFKNLENVFLLNEWLASLHSGEGILIRRVLYLRKLGKYEDALKLAKDSYSVEKSENRLVILIDLAIRTVNFAYARALCRESKKNESKEITQVIDLLNLRLNILLENTEAIKKAIAETQFVRFNTGEWYCAQSMISKSDKNWDAAAQYYRQAKTVWANRSTLQASSSKTGISGYDFLNELLDDDPYWIWDTAAGLLYWDDVISAIIEKSQKVSGHPAIQFILIKILTMAGEWLNFSEELELEKRKPAIGKEASEIKQLVQSCIRKLDNENKEHNIARWITRANIIFSNTPANIKTISDQLQMPEDLEFLAGLLRKEMKYAPAVEIAGKLGRHFKSIWQQAMCYKASDPKMGIELLKPELDHSSGFPFPYIVMGQLSEICEDYPAAYQAYRKAVNIWKEEPVWHTHCADLAEKCGDTGSTVWHLKKALDLGYRKMETGMKLGKIYQDRSEYQRAIEVLEPIHRDEPEDFSLLMQLGSACFALGDTKKAFDYAEQARSIEPDSEKPYKLYAQISDSMGQYQAAMEYARKALELKPGDEDILVLLSQYIEKSGNTDEAFQLLEDVVVTGEAGNTVTDEYVRRKYAKAGPAGVLIFLENLKDKGKLPEEMHAYLAEAYFAEGELTKAENEAMAAVKIDTDSQKMNYILAVIQRENGNLDLAAHYAAQAIQSGPDCMDAYLELAKIYQAKNETVKALEVYKQAIKSNPENYLGYFHAGLLLRETRDYREAEIMLRQAAKLVPDDVNIRRQLGAVVALNLVHNAQEEKIVP